MKKLSAVMSWAVALCAAAETVSVKSPDGLNEIRLETEPVLSFSVWRDGKARVVPTPITLTVSGRPRLGGVENHAYEGQTRRTRAGRVAAPVYKKAFVDDSGNEALVSFKGGWGVALHARNDGVAWRFETSFGGDVTVPAEGTNLKFPADASFLYGRTWGGLESSWEAVYQPAASIADIPAGRDHFIYLPLTVGYPDGTAMCVTESNVWDYPGLNFYRPEGADELRSWQAQAPLEVQRKGVHIHVKARRPYLAKTTGTRAYPWRVFLLAKNAIGLTESDAVWALAEPCRIADTSWIKPGPTAWNWWCANRLTDTGFEGRFNTRTFKAYIDFSAANKLPYMLVDAGWAGGFEGQDMDVIRPDFDLDELVKYARARNVGLILWAAWSDLADKQRRRRLFREFAARGVKGFKIDFFDRDDCEIADVTTEMARDAAENHLVLDFHGMHKPVGLSRTYPNVLNYEGIHGMEQEKFGGSAKTDFPANDVKAIYTRMLAGPMDYTPGAMGNVTRAAFKPDHEHPVSQGTRAHQLAMYVLYEAPLQMLSDSPSDYRKTPENQLCTDFMAQTPTTWDDTKGIGGELGLWAAMARRKGGVWYAAAMTDWTGRTVALDTSFLGTGSWTATVYADAPDAESNPEHFTKTVKTVSAGEKLTVVLAPGGGWAARFVPAGDGEMAQYDQGRYQFSLPAVLKRSVPRVKNADRGWIQKAIDAAAARGGGRVVVPAGVHNTGTIWLKSHVELHLAKGAVVNGSVRHEDYDQFPRSQCPITPEFSDKALICAAGEEDVSITGEGIIDGNGPAFYDTTRYVNNGGKFWRVPDLPRPRLLQMVNCRRVKIEGVVFRDAAAFTMYFRTCEDVAVGHIAIVGDRRITNNDGIDVDGCRRVRIGDSSFNTGDDCIALRAIRTRTAPAREVVCEDVVISNCTLSGACQAIRIGCPSDDTIRNVRVRNIDMTGSRNGIYFGNHLYCVREGDEGFFQAENIVFEGIRGKLSGNPIQILVDDGIKLRKLDGICFRDVDVSGAKPRFTTTTFTPYGKVEFNRVKVNGQACKDGQVEIDRISNAPFVRKPSLTWDNLN